MATIVREAQTPWWAPLAVSVLGGLYNDWQQREKNKKENAFLGELEKMRNQMQNGGEFNQETMPQPAPVQDDEQGLLNMESPARYGSNGWSNALLNADSPLAPSGSGVTGLAPATANNTALPLNAWANAFHQNNNPLLQYDLGTAGTVPAAATPAAVTAAAPAQAQGTGRAPIVTPMDFYNAAMQLAGSKRFRMLNADRVQNLIAPYMKINEEARKEQLRNELAGNLKNAQDAQSFMREIIGGGVTNTIDSNTMNNILSQTNPKQYSIDKGGSVDYGDYSPIFGYNKQGSFNKTLTPDQAAIHAYNRAKLAEDSKQFDRKLAYDYRNMQMEGMGVSHIQRDANGTTWIIRKNGTREQMPGQGMTEQQTVYFNSGMKRIGEIDAALNAGEAQLRGWQQEYNQATNDADKKAIKERMDRKAAEIEGLRRDKAQIQANINSMIYPSGTGGQGQTTTNNDVSGVGGGIDIGANMLGVSKPTITTVFNAPRKRRDGTPYGHAGIDYAMPKDSPIRLDDVGTTLKVTKVANDPKGYGNYVDAEGVLTDKDGKEHTISLRWAHMGNGTVNVTKGQEIRFGDLIGKVGNTGNSRGKNGGYHLHLETRIDGKLVDPTKFKELIAPYVAHTKTSPTNTFTGVTPPPKITVLGRQKETTVAYRNPKTGNEISQAEVEELEKRARNGEINNTHTPEEVHENFRKNGYIRVESENNTNSQGQTTSNDTKFSIVEQPTAQIFPKADPLDWRPSYTKVNLPLDQKTQWAINRAQNPTALARRVNPATFISYGIPTAAINSNVNVVDNNTIPENQRISAHDIDNETETQKALAQLNGQFNTWDNQQSYTWDNIFHNRYPLENMSDFWRV